MLTTYIKLLLTAVCWGELYILGCVGSWVAYSLLGKVVMAELSPLAAVTYSSGSRPVSGSCASGGGRCRAS